MCRAHFLLYIFLARRRRSRISFCKVKPATGSFFQILVGSSCTGFTLCPWPFSALWNPNFFDILFRCNPLKGCISRNRISTNSLGGSKLISRIQGQHDRKDKELMIKDQGLGIRDQELGIRDQGLGIRDKCMVHIVQFTVYSVQCIVHSV